RLRSIPIALIIIAQQHSATSNFVERCFSIARTTYGQERHRLQPVTLEMVLFLRHNGE
ncbi:hypothetical protein JG687_00006821, partial [Phytophthora cactorum]